MRISHTAITQSLGPGMRFVIWVQGCAKRCKGCINPEGWELSAGNEIPVDTLVSELIHHREIVGVTISGGEPFLQYQELKELIHNIKEKTSLDVMLYSGYTVEEIEEKHPEAAKEVFSKVDIFIDGEYIEEQNNNTVYRGSDNQKIYFFSDKYKEKGKELTESHKREFSFEIKENGEVFFVGIPPKGFYSKFIEKLGEVE